MPTIQQITDLLNLPALPEGSRQLTGVTSIEAAGPTDLCALSTDQYVKSYKITKAGCVLAGRKIKFQVRPDLPTILVDDAELALVKVMQFMAPPIPQPMTGIDRSAVVAPTAVLGENASIGPHVVIGERTRIGKNARINAGVVISDDVVIGDDVVIFPNVVIRERITIGSRVIINAGTIIGTDGFGYRWDGKQHAKIPQIGTVVIEDDVEIGSCVCIDRAKFNETRIGRGTKVDNLVQIAHNVKIGMHTIICGQVGIAGTATIGNGVVLGGATVVRDHITIGDGVMAGGHTVVIDSVPAKQMVSGYPALPHRQALREEASIRRLPEMLQQLRKLQEEVEKLKKAAEATA